MAPRAVNTLVAPTIYPPASARNMGLLVQLRWIAVFGQLVTIAVAWRILGITLPLAQLIALPSLLAAINLVTMALDRRRSGYTSVELLGALMLDVMALAWQLYLTGGTTNPFAFLFLLQIVIGAILLPPRWSAIVALVAGLTFAVLALEHRPLVLPQGTALDHARVYLFGNFLCFLLIGALLLFFVIRIDRNRRQSDEALATLRQRAAEEHHIVRMGLLASGAAHELGTPMATMSVLVSDWRRHPAFRASPELREELDEVDTELRRCKSIVTGILLAAGEARGENPLPMMLSDFLTAIASEWTVRSSGALRWVNDLREDRLIIADTALRQVIGNVIDNALEVSPGYVELRSHVEEDALVLSTTDRGPGFTPEMMDALGRPYSSTKGRAGGGLGLFLVVNVIRRLGGKVAVSNVPGGGALVRLSIPLSVLSPEDESSQ
jgi:two-component system sensor histidine kinase RegB